LAISLETPSLDSQAALCSAKALEEAFLETKMEKRLDLSLEANLLKETLFFLSQDQVSLEEKTSFSEERLKSSKMKKMEMKMMMTAMLEKAAIVHQLIKMLQRALELKSKDRLRNLPSSRFSLYN
jgi:hypothetical protein